MCGIAGVVRLDGDGPVDASAVERMLDAIAHRGPDGRGVLDLGVAALGAVRLAVRDTSERGNQPMSTADGRHHLVFNGELYDLPDLRRTVSGPLRSTSDTEVLLHALAEHGDPTWDRLNGMLAAAWWDSHRRRLVLTRDRFGEKPLFWARHGGCLWFASEEKALFAAGVPAEFDPATWPELLAFRYVAGERTPYVGVQRVLPGHLLEVRDGGLTTTRWHTPRRVRGPDLADVLSTAVQRRLVADVPVGVLISGGIDSSSVAALAADVVGPDLPAYTVSYPGEPNDESHHARAVASHLGLRLREIVVPHHDLPALLETATWLRGEPIALAPSPHLLALSSVARQEVTVLLSGEGSDELLGGYSHHRPHRYPRLSTAAGHALRALPTRSDGVLVRRARRAAHRRIELSNATTFPGCDWSDAALPYRSEAAHGRGHPLQRVMTYDQRTFLPSVLAMGDRSTMGVGLEARAPFLDPDVAALAAGYRPRELFARGVGKAPLRRAMAGRLPAAVIQRRKAPWVASWRTYLTEVPALRERVRWLPHDPVIRDAPLPAGAVEAAVARFLSGSGADFSLVWALVRVSVWHDVCVLGRRHVFA